MKKIFSTLLCCVMLNETPWASASFKETYSERLVTIRLDGEVSREVLAGGSFSLRSKVGLSESDFTIAPTGETPVKITVGGGLTRVY